MCVFCDINTIKSEVTEINNCYVFKPLNPVVPGHILIVNKTHTEDFTDNAVVFAETCVTASIVADQIGGDFNLITSKGQAATQSVFHCHIHLVPRKENDGLTLPWTLKPSTND